MKKALPLLLLLAACKPNGPAHPSGGAAGGGKRPFPVEVRTVVTEDVKYIIDAVGTLEPEEQVKVTARVQGMVEKVFFEEGTKVTTKTVLAEIDRPRYQMLADRAKASQERATADMRKAEIVLQNRMELKKKDPGYVSDEEIATLSSQLASTRAAAAEAKSSLDLALHDFENSQVRSLLTGVIDTKAVSTGQYVIPGALMASIVDESKLKLRFKVSETESVKLASVLGGDRRVTFSVRPLPGKTFTAELIHMSPQANVQTRTVECLALVENRDALLKPGFFATVKAVVAVHEKAIVVPDSAILPTERGFVAYVVKGSRAVLKQVRPGLFVREGAVEILEGLIPGDSLITTGSTAVSDGVEVLVKPQPPVDGSGKTGKE